MKTFLSSQILLAVIASFWVPTAARGQITFVRSPDGTNSPANTRQGQQSQQRGLSPDKKKSLSKIGPEDAFPGATEQEDRQRKTNRTNQRRSGASSNQSAAPAPTPTLASAPTATSLPTPSPTQIAATPQPSPTSPALTTGSTDLASNLTTQTPAGKSSGSPLVPVSLAIAALLVFGALVYVVGSLRKKLKGN